MSVLQMPIMDGNDSAIEMRKYEKTLDNSKVSSVIIGVSANLGEHMTLMAERAGMDAFLTKPFKLDDLIKSYEQILSGNISQTKNEYRDYLSSSP